MADGELRPDEISDADIDQIMDTIEKSGVSKPHEEMAELTVCLNHFIKDRILSIGDAKHILTHAASIMISGLKWQKKDQ